MGNDWKLNVNLAGITPMDPTRVGLPTGGYEVVILDSYTKPAKDPTKPDNIVFDLQVKAGEHAGAGLAITMGSDMEKKGNKMAWTGLLLSVGAPPAALANPIPLGPKSFENKAAFVYVVERNKDEKDSFEQRSFITKEKYLQVQKLSASVAAAPAATATPQPSAGVGSLAAALGGTPAAPAVAAW